MQQFFNGKWNNIHEYRAVLFNMKPAMIFYPVAVAALLSVACSKDVSDASANPVDSGKTSTTVPATVNKTLMLQLINQTRQKGCQCGDTYYYPVSTVVWNDLL